MVPMRCRVVVIIGSLLGACGGEDEPRPASGTSGFTVSDSLASTPTADDSGSDTGERLDLGGGVDLPSQPMRCDKIDLVFVVDNSASMYDEQQSLLASFPSFIAEIEAVLESDDYQVLVIDTDIGEGGGCYEAMYNSFDCGLWCGANCLDGCNCECNSAPCAPFTDLPCDARLGAGRVATAGGVACGLPPERRYLVSTDADPDGAFACMASVGILGEPNERPMQALAAALGELAEPGACNAGFLRDDALLVVTVVTDEDDALASLGDPADWKAALVAAKGGYDASVVALGLLGDSDLPGAVCTPFDGTDNSGAQPSVRLRQWAESFPFGSWASVCEPDYVPFFRDAIATIDTACEEFVPAG